MHFSINGGTVSFGENTVLTDIHFEIRNSEKIAVVGRNGSGKSTLLKLICSDKEVLDNFDGDKSSFKRDVTVGYLKQITFEDTSVSLDEELKKAFSRIIGMKEELDKLLKEMETDESGKKAERYNELYEYFCLLGGNYYKKEYETVLKSFGFSKEDKEKPLSAFSGGQRTKIAFMKLLLSKPDILLLDEPTNHLDADTVEWLYEYIKSYPSAVVTVSHDRMFLDKTVSIIYDIEHKTLKRYVGNYTQFCKIKEELYERQLKAYEAQKKEIEKTNALIERFRYKATKASMVQSRIKMLERTEIIEPPKKFNLKQFYADTTPLVQSGSVALNVKNLTIGYEKPLGTVDFELLRGEKLGVIGKNGIGKTTLLKTLVGKIKPLSGTFSFGVNTKVGYFDQQLLEDDGNATVFDDYTKAFPLLTNTEARNDLGAFLFSGDDVFKPVSVLSGGEKVRLALCKIFKNKPNILILDEPTNHTDILGKEALEEMLKKFEGTVICVSHDMYFINKVCDRLLVFEDGKVTFNKFGYERYEYLKKLNKSDGETKPIEKKEEKKEKVKNFSPLKEFTKTEKKRIKAEEKIALKEEEISGIKAEMLYPENQTDYQKLTELSKEIEEVQTELSVLYTEWEELSKKEAELKELLK